MYINFIFKSTIFNHVVGHVEKNPLLIKASVISYLKFHISIVLRLKTPEEIRYHTMLFLRGCVVSKVQSPRNDRKYRTSNFSRYCEEKIISLFFKLKF